MSRQFDAKQEALKAYPTDRQSGVDMFLGFLDVSEDDFKYEEGMSAEEYIYGRETAPSEPKAQPDADPIFLAQSPPPNVKVEGSWSTVDQEPTAWLCTSLRTGNKDLRFEPIADLPFNQENWCCEPLYPEHKRNSSFVPVQNTGTVVPVLVADTVDKATAWDQCVKSGQRSDRRIAELEAALAPFAQEATAWPEIAPDDYQVKIILETKVMRSKITVGDLRRARAALSTAKEGGQS